jgi:hypothetical protein
MDPKDLRYSAARLLVQLADPEDGIGVVSFHTEATTVGGEAPQEGVAGHQSLIDQLIAPGIPDKDGSGRGNTRIDKGLDLAIKMLSSRPNDRPRYILYLSDGEPWPDNRPEDGQTQTRYIAGKKGELARLGIQVFPIALCNGRCPNGTVGALQLMLMDDTRETVDQIGNADLLVERFSTIFAKMKPTLHVLPVREFEKISTKPYHAVTRMSVVTAVGKFQQLMLGNDSVVVTPGPAEEKNISVNTYESGNIGEGTWTVRTVDRSGFLVAHARTYPELYFPPPSVPQVFSAPRYVPEGSSPVLVATMHGPVGATPLFLNGSTELSPLSKQSRNQNETVDLVSGPHDPSKPFSLQVGPDVEQLLIRRDFALTQVTDIKLPRAAIIQPDPPCEPGKTCTLTANFAHVADTTDVSNVGGRVYVLDQIEGSNVATPLQDRDLACPDGQCAFSFTPDFGHTYQVLFTLTATDQKGRIFGDSVQTTIATRPSITISGLGTGTLDLGTQPVENGRVKGWNVKVQANLGNRQPPGVIRGDLALYKTGETTPVSNVSLGFNVNVTNSAEQDAVLIVEHLEELEAGEYTGQIIFSATNPNADVLMPPPVAVKLSKLPLRAEVRIPTLSFPEVVFDPASTAPLVQTATLGVRYDTKVFPLNIVMDKNKASDVCGGGDFSLEMNIAGDPRPRGDGGAFDLDVVIKSKGGVVSPVDCSGTFSLSAAQSSSRASDHEITIPVAGLKWDLVVRRMEAKVLAASDFVDFGSSVYDPSAEVSVPVTLPVSFRDGYFPLKVTTPERDPSDPCGKLQIKAGQAIQGPNGYELPVLLTSEGVFEPRACRGTFTIEGNPRADYLVTPRNGAFEWEFEVPPVEWSLKQVNGSDTLAETFYLGDLREPGDQVTLGLTLQYTAKPPFNVRVSGDRLREGQQPVLDWNEYLQPIVETVEGSGDKDHQYQVPVTLKVVKEIPHQLLGTVYNSTLKVSVDGIEGSQEQPVSYSFRAPSLVQSKIGPFFIVPFPCFFSLIGLLVLLITPAYMAALRRVDSGAPPAGAGAGGPPGSPPPGGGLPGAQSRRKGFEPRGAAGGARDQATSSNASSRWPPPSAGAGNSANANAAGTSGRRAFTPTARSSNLGSTGAAPPGGPGVVSQGPSNGGSGAKTSRSFTPSRSTHRKR